MKSAKLPYILQALLAALFFGASAPLSKLLLGDVPPVLMAAFLYLGSGTGITLMKALQKKKAEASLGRADCADVQPEKYARFHRVAFAEF